MKQLFCSAVFLVLLAGTSYPIGMQHGLFRSQSTQGAQWIGTAAITSEKYSITVYPDYLDVELDWVFRASGTAAPDSFSNALEIVGNLNLENNSVIVSMLVWYNGHILKGKLKSNGVAREQYEQVVERNADAPPPPRDPVLLEMIRDDNYDISIFPVSFNGERRVRIRYLIPGATVNGVVKMGYPHAFTDSAIVEIRSGTGVDGYQIETSTITGPVFNNIDYSKLSDENYSFKPYSPVTGKKSISYIVPVIPFESGGSRMYVADFSDASFSGTMVHTSIPGAANVLLKSSAKEDFVVIWRWNHSDILRAYTAQIVEQAKVLRSFFKALNSTSKRGALIISIQGGETVSFSLDKNGGDVFDEMLAYLDNLCAMAVPQNPATLSTTLQATELEALAKSGLEEFKEVLQKAVAMLENSEAKKRILVLTAGAQILTGYEASTAGVFDPSVDTRLFSSVYSGSGSVYTASVSMQRWPGLLISQPQAVTDTAYKIFGYISNGTVTDSFSVYSSTSYYGFQAICDRYNYSDRPVVSKITYKIFAGGTVVDQIEEQASVVPVTDVQQFARCIGSLKSMVPLAATMPSSVASTLGFIDMKYTLLALEEDLLDPATAEQYENSGVPLLDKADIYPAADEKAAIPVADWLVANPREFEGQGLMNGWIMDDARRVEMKTTVAQGAAARWTNPVAQTIIVETRTDGDQSKEVASVKQDQIKSVSTRTVSLGFANGCLRLTSGQISQADISCMVLALYDLKGRIIYRWKLSEIMNGSTRLLAQLPKLKTGMYLVRLEKGSFSYSTSFMIR